MAVKERKKSAKKPITAKPIGAPPNMFLTDVEIDRAVRKGIKAMKKGEIKTPQETKSFLSKMKKVYASEQ